MLHAVVILAGLMIASLAPPAHAHAVLMGTEPADRAILSESPDRIVLRFNEPVMPVAVRLIDGMGKTANDAANVHSLDGKVEVALPRPLSAGIYLLSYRVTSADSHAVAGSFTFAVGPPPENWAIADQTLGPDWAPFLTVNRFFLVVSSIIVAGGSLFLVLIAGDTDRARILFRPLVGSAAVVVVMTAVLTVGLQGGMLSGAPFAALADPATWRLGLSTTRSLQSLALIAGCGAILGGMKSRPGRWRTGLTLGGAVAVTASFALSGHMATAAQRWAMLPALCLHVTLAAFWLGSFLPLLATLRSGRPEEVVQVRRFSAFAVVAVPVLIAAGIVMACAWIENPAALVETDYGRLLLAKTALVAALLGLAAINRFRLMPRLSQGAAVAVPRLRATIKAEIAVGVAIVIATVGLSQTPPHGTAAQAAHGHEAGTKGFTTVVPHRGRIATIQVMPVAGGRHRVDVIVTDNDGKVVEKASQATLFLSNPALGIEAVQRPMIRHGAGAFRYEGPELTIGGNWVIRADVLFGDFEKSSFETTARLP